MKILYITTIGSTMDFFESLIKELINKGNVVDIATNESEKPVSRFFKDLGCKVFPLTTSRSPLSIGNIRAIRQIKSIAKDYDIVHCHTPLASIATRFACKSFRKNGLEVIYTAHGFHFFKGAPLKNWLLFYPIEWLCSFWTDVLITINREDHQRAQKRLHAKKIEYVPGVGIDCHHFSVTTERIILPDVPPDAFVILSVGELNKNKNHETVIRAVAALHDPNIHYLIAGKGDLLEHLQKTAADLGIGKQIHFLGFRRDVDRLYHMADLYVLPSFREGLNVSLMEAMASGLPVVCSEIRGNRDMIRQNEGGFLVPPGDAEAYISAIRQIRQDPKMAEVMGKHNAGSAKQYDIGCINQMIKKIYGEIV